MSSTYPVVEKIEGSKGVVFDLSLGLWQPKHDRFLMWNRICLPFQNTQNKFIRFSLGLAATPFQGKYDRNHMLWNSSSTDTLKISLVSNIHKTYIKITNNCEILLI
jgi:hypothetical protein